MGTPNIIHSAPKLEDPGIFFVSGPSQGAFFVPHAPRFSAAAAREALAQPVD